MEKFEPIRIKDIMNHIDAKVSTLNVLVISPAGNLISRLEDEGKLAAATMIVNGSAIAKDVFLGEQWKARPMYEIMAELDKQNRNL